MKHFIRTVALGMMALVMLLGVALGKTFPPPISESADKTLSPYFFVKSDETGVDQMPLKVTSAKVSIAGVIADVHVTQVYRNEAKRPLEAIYVFPASTRAAVYGMKMTIGTRVITAKIAKRDEARQQYEEARQQGKSASLLEQQRPNVFQMNVANIMPGDEIRVELAYTEVLVPTDKVYEFAYPTVVGPRYSNQPAATAAPSEHWVQNPYLHQGETPAYTFDISLALSAGLPIRDLASASHKVTIGFDGPATAQITLDPSEKSGGNRDFILRYRLAGDRVQSGLLLHQGEKENFFLLMLQPPKRVATAQIPAREYIFIVDVSGSMFGFPLDISKKLLADLIGNLRPTDLFNVLLFSGGSSVMSEQSVPATAENIARAVQLIERQRGGGGTELLPALTRALSLKRHENFSRTVVIATDGYVMVEEEVFDLMRKNLGDANMFTFGIGSSVNRHIIEGMAHIGLGEPFVITKADEAPAAAARFRTLISSPVLTKVKIDFDGFAAYDVEPMAVPDVLADRPIMVFGKWRGRAAGTITVSGVTGSGPYSQKVKVAGVKPSRDNSALHYLWARQRITLLSDYNSLRPRDERIQEVTSLGLAYNLLTAYTSFVAIDSEVRNKEGQAVTVKQPLPLPKGVSDYAVGGMGSSRMALAPTAQKMAPAAEQECLKDEGLKKKDAAVTLGDVSATGALSKEAVTEVVRKGLPELQRCRSGRSGNVTVEVKIDGNGKVKEVKIVKGAARNSALAACLIEGIRKWQFPGAANGSTTKATIVFFIGA